MQAQPVHHNPTRDEVDEILRKKRKLRGGKACYPCAKRKVKCDSSERVPCSNCVRRNHPEICTYEPGADEPPPNRPRTTPPAQRAASHKSSPQPASAIPGRLIISTPTNPVHPRRTVKVESGQDSGPELRPFLSQSNTREDSFVGENAAPSLVGHRPGSRSVARDLRPILGLEGPQYAAYPFLDPATTAEQTRKQFIALLPGTEVTRHFQFYKNNVFIHSPMMVDIDEFEAYLWNYLETFNAHDRHRNDKVLLDKLERDVGQIALILAVCASGSQFSDLKLSQRITLSRDFSRRSFQCLRLANFLFKPSLETIQALLILGTVLQNDGQSDGAWALLGLTVRLAQCQGLHTERSARVLPEHIQKRRKALWNKVMWQDALLSLSYDRIPALAAYRTSNIGSPHESLDFVSGMHILCRIGLSSLIYSGDDQLQLGPLLQCLAEVDELYQKLLPHIQNEELCSTLQQRREHLAFRLHSSFLISILARPAFRSGAQPGAPPQFAILMDRGRAALCAATRAYLDLHLMDVYPRRAWGMIHQGLSSALLLGILGEGRARPEIVELQLRVIDVLSKAEEAEVSNGDVPTAWLSSSHVRALRALRSTVSNQSRRSSQSSVLTAEGAPASASASAAGPNTASVASMISHPTPTPSVGPPPNNPTNHPPNNPTDHPSFIPNPNPNIKNEEYQQNIPWVVPTGTNPNEMMFDPNLMPGYDDGLPMDFGLAMQHTGMSPMGYFDAVYWQEPSFANEGLSWNAPPQQGYWGL